MRVIRLLLVCLCFVAVLGELPSQETLALLEFKKGIKHDPSGYVLDSWNNESIDVKGCSSWYGIICNSSGIVGIVLDNLGLSADVDLSVLANLTMLEHLSISNNSISGKLPENLGNFKKLQHLDVSNNLFSSSLPVDIGKLALLQNLSLAGNNFSGLIPDSISGLTSIRSMDLSRNALSGPLPLSLTMLEGLVYLNLSLNSLTKSIPKGFELMAQLDVIDLHGNMLDGELAPEFLLFTTASHVDLSGNLLVSSAKDQQSFLRGVSPSVKHLNLSHNQLTGSNVGGGSPQAFGSLNVLDLSYNQLSGELPGFTFVYDLQVLKLRNNGFSGLIPNNLLKGDSLVLTELDLSRNKLSGPVSMITSTTLNILNLSSNVLSGELPLLTGSCAVVDLSNNLLEGNLTRMLKWGNVEVLDLSQNRLTGSIPEVTAQFLRLHYLNISYNSLGGSLPKVIALFPKLVTLDLSFNQLDGPLLTTLLTSATLTELHLHSNKLSGSIDLSSSSGGSSLQVLDFSNNQIDGRFPEEFGSFAGLQMLNIGGNNLNGSLPSSICNLSGLNSLDISQNHFTGPLPSNLSSNLESLNVSYNDLSGVVPENLRKFPQSSFYPGNSRLQFPNPPVSSNAPSGNGSKKHLSSAIKIVIIVVCVVSVIVLILLLAIFIHHKRTSRRRSPHVANKDSTGLYSPSPTFGGRDRAGGLVVSAEDVVTSQKGSASDTISPDEKAAAITGFSPSKNSNLSWSPESGDSNSAENLSRLDDRSPERLGGELNFLDDTVSFTSEELSRAPAEVLGRSSHGTSYKATLDNGLILTVKWLREGVAKQRKEFAKEAKKFSNIRHPNVVGLRGYYWGPTQHEKLILSDYISPGNLASFLYDRPGRKVQPLTWLQRLKVAVDVARGLNYLHFDRATPHGNLKATNILLDGPDLTARVADYCLHRLMTQSGTMEQILDAGVLGYRAPELAASKKPVPSFKSDVYAFGVILLEILTGKCAGDVVSGEEGGIDLTDWVRLRVAQGRGSDCIEAALAQETKTPAVDKGVKELLGIALRCIRSVSERPGIKTVYEDLSSI
ncbi:Leucine-rich receptor-like protein kinase family protein [Perilla frutescens var. hirtella]|nr:Leucine-rich receptor-like protein kinase family protein [Perilla frutescens var. hirtella]